MNKIIRFLILLIFGIVLPFMVAIIVTDTFYLDLAWMILIWGVTTVLAIILLIKLDKATSSGK